MTQPSALENSSEAFLQSVFETAVDGIIVIDRQGIIVTVNPSACRLFGYESSEMLGRNVNLLMASPHQEQHDGYIGRYLRTGVPHIIGIGREVEGRTKSGASFPFRLSISEVKLDDGSMVFTGIVHDITAVKKVEKELRDLNAELEAKVRERTEELSKAVNRLLSTNSELEMEIGERKRTEHKLLNIHLELQEALEREKELGDLKSRFLTLASHEFRTPLTAILSSASLIARYQDETGQAKRQRHIDRIYGAVRTLNGLLEDFLNVGRLEEGKIQVHLEELDLARKVRDWTEEFRESIWKEGSLNMHPDSETQMVLVADERILQNILLNLLSNAVKYSTEPIDVEVFLTQKDDFAQIQVRDHGIGIPEKDQEHLSERFFRAANVSHIQGTGLGLHIVREYIALLGGSLSFSSELQEGSVFTVNLPTGLKDRLAEHKNPSP